MREAEGHDVSAADTQETRIVWLASYPRSGNSWLRFQLGAYACGKAESWTVCNAASFDLHNLLGAAKHEDHDLVELARSVRDRSSAMPHSVYRAGEACIKTHFKWSLGHPWREHTEKVIYVLRHPRDVLLSAINYLQLMRKDSGSAREAAWEFVRNGGVPRWRKHFGSWYEHYESWTTIRDYPALLLRYEDLKRDPLAEFVRVIRFLELPLDIDRAKKAVAETLVDKVRKLEVDFRSRHELPQFRKGLYLVREGKTDQSLARIDPDLDSAFDRAFAEKLKATGYGTMSEGHPEGAKGHWPAPRIPAAYRAGAGRPSVLIYTTHRAASMFLHRITKKICVFLRLSHVSINDPAYHDVIKSTSWAQVIEDSTGPACFGPIRASSAKAVIPPDVEEAAVILHLRDPRDVLTSLFFSHTRSHPRLQGEFDPSDERRLEWERRGIDEFVRRRARGFARRYKVLLDGFRGLPNVRLLKYEEMVRDYGRWLGDFILGFEPHRQPRFASCKTPGAVEHLIEKLHELLYESHANEFAVESEDPAAHKRKVKPGDHREKLSGETIEYLNEEFREVLRELAYEV